MGQVKNNFDAVMKQLDIELACRKLPRKAISLMYSFGHSENFENMVGMPDIFINLIKYFNRSTRFFDTRTDDDFKCYVLENIFNILESENFRKGVISVEYIYRIIDKLNKASNSLKFRFNNSVTLFFDLICNFELDFTESILNEFCDYLGQERMLVSIGNFLVENVKKDDKYTNDAIANLIYNYIYNEDLVVTYDGKISYLFFILCEDYINGEISKDRFDSIINLINMFYNDCQENKKSIEEIEPYVRNLVKIIERYNFKKGIIPNSYLEEYFKCSYGEQLRTMANLLTCEYYEEGFITEEHIKLVSNDEDYIIITCMLDYILTGGISVEGNKYDSVLGILNFDRKKELCNKLYSYLENVDDIEEIKRVALNYLQYNLFFPKFEVKPFARERVLEGGK